MNRHTALRRLDAIRSVQRMNKNYALTDVFVPACNLMVLRANFDVQLTVSHVDVHDRRVYQIALLEPDTKRIEWMNIGHDIPVLLFRAIAQTDRLLEARWA